jgi:hypothetical protein
MKKSALFFLGFCISFSIYSQKPKSGTYTYSISFEEWEGKSLGATCTVIINKDSIKIIHSGKGDLTGKNGDILDQGIIMKHKKSGNWIVAYSPNDIYAKEIGGCTGGPTIISFKLKKWFTC